MTKTEFLGQNFVIKTKNQKMKRIYQFPIILAMLASFMMFTNCTTDALGDDVDDALDDLIGDIDDGNDDPLEYDLIVNASNALVTSERHLEIEAVPGSTVTVNLKFTSDKEGDDNKMRRVYATQYNYGDTEISQFVFPGFIDTKADGSIDIESADGFDFFQQIEFPTPSALGETVQYNIWTTSGRGDFRDVSKRNAIAGDAFGSITIVGAEVESEGDIADAASVLNTFTQTVLFVPTADGTSESFISLFDAQTHVINEGAEKLAFWDFGYFYGQNTGASFYSVYDYPEVFKIGEDTNGDDILGHVSDFVGAELSELNRFYFAESGLDFDSVSTSADLDGITKSSSERIQGMQVGDVVEFVDQYGNKGLIKITALDPGFNQGDSITFDVKVQVNATPIIL